MQSASPRTMVLEFGMGVDVHGQDCTKAARRAVSDAIRHSSLPLLGDIRERGGTMLVHVTVAVPEPEAVDPEAVKAELPTAKSRCARSAAACAYRTATR